MDLTEGLTREEWLAGPRLRWDYTLTTRSPEYMNMWRRRQCRCGKPITEEPFRRSDGSRYTVLTCYGPLRCGTIWYVEES